MPVKIALVGEAWGDHEARAMLPFVGPAGRELDDMLEEAGIRRGECFVTNVFNFQPLNNDIETLCSPKKAMPKDYSLPPIKSGCYIRPEFLKELDRLKNELNAMQPNLVVALGNVPCWALLQRTGITKIRGTVCKGVLTQHKVLPTFHPAYILRNWNDRPTTIMDLMKVKREAEFPEVKVYPRRIHIAESLSDLDFIEKALNDRDELSTDIETHAKQITCIGFSQTIDDAYVIPFWNWTKPGLNHWEFHHEERAAWHCIKRILARPMPKLGQNFIYDMQYLFRHGVFVKNVREDTMLLHHALQPEAPKSLGFLGSIYCNEIAWKLINPKFSDKLKADDL